MIKKKSLSEGIANKFFEMGIIAKDDVGLYAYGLWLTFAMILNVVSTLFIGVLMGMLSTSAVILLCYIPLRRYVGGYHARTPGRCYMYSILSVFVLLCGVKRVEMSVYVEMGILIFTGVSIFVVAPVEDSNKPLDADEQRKYGKKARYIFVLESAIVFVTSILKIEYFRRVITWCFMMLCVLLWAGVCRNYRLKRNEKE